MGLSASAAFGCGSSHLTGSAGVCWFVGLSFLDRRRENKQVSSLEAFPLRGLEFIFSLSSWQLQ